jgi:hypothetical protein
MAGWGRLSRLPDLSDRSLVGDALVLTAIEDWHNGRRLMLAANADGT